MPPALRALIAFLFLTAGPGAASGAGPALERAAAPAHEEEAVSVDSTDTEEEAAAEEEEDKGPEFEEVIEDFVKIEGLFDLYHDEEENKVYLAIRPEQLDQIYLCSITRTQGDGYFFDSASLIHPAGRGWGAFPIVFEKIGTRTSTSGPMRTPPSIALSTAVSPTPSSVPPASRVSLIPRPAPF